MYIVTTSKKLHQVTIGAMAVVIILGLLWVRYYYQQNVVAPNEITQRIYNVVANKQPLESAHIDIPMLREEETLRVKKLLIEDLTSSQLPEPEQAAVLLLGQATSYLQTNESLLEWLNVKLSLAVITPSSEWLKLSSSKGEQYFRAKDHCIGIRKFKVNWKVVSFKRCAE